MTNSAKPSLFEPPTFVDGESVARAVILPNGSARIESWDVASGSWRQGGATWSELAFGRALTAAELRSRGITS